MGHGWKAGYHRQFRRSRPGAVYLLLTISLYLYFAFCCRDAETGKQIKKLVDHSSFVNSVSVARRGPPLVVSGSDDGTAKVSDISQHSL
jgi:WD40 repeat protein